MSNPPTLASSPSPARRRNPRGQGLRLRRELLDAACRLLDGGTPESALSLRGLAREAGVAAPSCYAHFASLDDLVVAVLEELFAELDDRLEHAGSGKRDPVSRLRALCLAYCTFAAERPGRYRAMFSRTWKAPPHMSFETFPGFETFTLLVDAVTECRPGRADDAFETAVGVWSALHGIVTLRQSLPRFPWPPLERQVDAVLRSNEEGGGS